MQNNTLPNNLIMHDWRRHLDLKARRESAKARLRAKRKAETLAVLKRFATAVLTILVFAIITHLAQADSEPVAAGIESDHLVSHDMVKYMMIHAHGQVLTECDMQ